MGLPEMKKQQTARTALGRVGRVYIAMTGTSMDPHMDQRVVFLARTMQPREVAGGHHTVLEPTPESGRRAALIFPGTTLTPGAAWGRRPRYPTTRRANEHEPVSLRCAHR